MKKHLFWIAALALLLFPVPALADAPHQVGGFILGTDISEYKDVLDMNTSLAIRHSEYIKEVEVMNLEGFKSGLIGYGTCNAPEKILRIKLKYENPKKKFYEQLLDRFKKQFGEPDQWRGDPFHIVLAWKWSFKDKNNNKISLTLQHNTKDTEEKVGNAVKLTMTSQIAKERSCFEGKYPDFRKGKKKKGKKKKIDWERFVPR